MKTYRIFLASSADMATERIAFGDIVQGVNDQLLQQEKHVGFMLDKWERNSDAEAAGRKQEEYNALVDGCAIFVALYGATAGSHTVEEYDRAYMRLLATGTPKVLVYKSAAAQLDSSAVGFEKRIVETNGQYFTLFGNPAELGVKFAGEVTKLFANGYLQDGGPAKAVYTGDAYSVPAAFVGREGELKLIRQKLNQDIPQFLVYAEGGIGKTSLAAKYVKDNLYNYEYTAWLFCGGGLMGSLKKLAVQFGIDLSGMNESQQLETLKQGLLHFGSEFLLVLDNANARSDLKDFTINFRDFKWHVLITSRCSDVFDPEYELHLLPLPSAQAKSFFKRYYTEESPGFENLLDQFLAAVGCHTLVVELVAKMLRKYSADGTTMAGFLQNFEQEQGLFLENGAFRISADHPLNIHRADLETAEAIIDALYDFTRLNDDERYLMINLSLIPAVNYRPSFLIDLLGRGGDDPLRACLEELGAGGWLSFGDEGYRVSPVIQKLIRQKYQAILPDNARPLIFRLSQVFQLEGNDLAGVTYKEARPFLPVADELTSHLVNADCVAAEPSTLMTVLALSAPFEYLAMVNMGTCVVYTNTGDLTSAARCLENYKTLVDKARAVNPASDITSPTARVKYLERMGAIYEKMRDTPSALNWYLQYNTETKKMYETLPAGDVPLQYALSGERLGDIYVRLGNWDQAEIYYTETARLFDEMSLKAPESLLLKNGRAISCEKQAAVFEHKGQTEKALELYKERVRLSEEVHEAEPENINYRNSLSIAYNLLGSLYYSMDQTAPALDNFQKDYDISLSLSNGLPENLDYKKSLAVASKCLGEVREEMGMQQEALQLYKSAFNLAYALITATPANAEFVDIYQRTSLKLGWIAVRLGLSQESLFSLQAGFSSQYTAFMSAARPEAAAYPMIAAEKLVLFFEAIEDWTMAIEYSKVHDGLVKQYCLPVADFAGLWYGMGVAAQRTANAYIQLKEWQNAAASYQDAIIILEQLPDDPVLNPSPKMVAASFYFFAAENYMNAHQFGKASPLLATARDRFVAFLVAEPGNETIIQNLRMIDQRLAIVNLHQTE